MTQSGVNTEVIERSSARVVPAAVRAAAPRDGSSSAYGIARRANPPAEPERPLAAPAGAAAACKRAVDLLVAAAALVVLSPLLGLVAVAVRLDSPGPALFRQVRRGRNRRVFRVLKFRTMYREASADFRQAEREDVRVTRVGTFLRRTSLDELPQLFNVLEGSMSVVGPRPHPLALDALYEPLIAGYGVRYAVKPGITGWAQVNGYRGETRRLEDMLRRIAHDRAYIEHWSLALDTSILARTLAVGWRQENAY